jgi:flavodoxin
MRVLLVYYTRSGVTRRAGLAIAEALGRDVCDVEEIVDRTSRAGALGYLRAGRDAALKRLTDIDPPTRVPEDYDLLIAGTPVWAFNCAPAIRTYLTQRAGHLPAVAFFCTMGGSGAIKTFANLAELAGREPLATLALLERDVRAGTVHESVASFIATLGK